MTCITFTTPSASPAAPRRPSAPQPPAGTPASADPHAPAPSPSRMAFVERTIEMLRIDRHHPRTPSTLATTTALILSATGWTVRTTGAGRSHEHAIGSPDDNVESIVRQVESLHAISAHELTRVHAAPELAARLPLLLRPVAVDAGPPEPAWPDDVVEEEIWDWEALARPLCHASAVRERRTLGLVDGRERADPSAPSTPTATCPPSNGAGPT